MKFVNMGVVFKGKTTPPSKLWPSTSVNRSMTSTHTHPHLGNAWVREIAKSSGTLDGLLDQGSRHPSMRCISLGPTTASAAAGLSRKYQENTKNNSVDRAQAETKLHKCTSLQICIPPKKLNWWRSCRFPFNTTRLESPQDKTAQLLKTERIEWDRSSLLLRKCRRYGSAACQGDSAQETRWPQPLSSGVEDGQVGVVQAGSKIDACGGNHGPRFKSSPIGWNKHGRSW